MAAIFGPGQYMADKFCPAADRMWLLDLVLPCNTWSGPGQYVADHLVLADRMWQLDLVLLQYGQGQDHNFM